MQIPNSPGRLDIPARIVFGGGSRRRLPELVAELGGTRVLLVTDPGIVALGVADEVASLLRAAGLSVAVFDQVQPDPTDENVASGVAVLLANRSDIVIALGGGSPIDTAKVVAVRPANPSPLPDYMGLHRISNPGLPVIAVPTTAGTGSEATKVAVITDTARNVKMMMLSAPLLPAAAVVDYELTLGMPRPLTAAVGVDTLTHGIEAFVSRKANPFTDPLAMQCIRLAAQHLERACDHPSDPAAREAMMLSATLGGMAFSNSSVCLVHGMSRPLGAVFHLPHGLSNAVLLPAVTRFSVIASPKRYAEIAKAVGCVMDEPDDSTACEALIVWLERLNHALSIPRLGQCPGVTGEILNANIEKMAADALASGSPANNPRVPLASDIVRLYRDAV